jgi:hypothetical protein
MSFIRQLALVSSIFGLIVSTSVVAQIVASPSVLFFGNVAVNTDAAPQTLTIKNSGTSAAFLTSTQLAAPTNYRITGGTCNTAGQTLSAGQACTMVYVFRSSAQGLSIFNSAPVFGAQFVAAAVPSTTALLTTPAQTANFGLVIGNAETGKPNVSLTLPFSPGRVQFAYNFTSLGQISSQGNCSPIVNVANACKLSLRYEPNAPELTQPVFLVVDNEQLIQVNVVGSYRAAASPVFSISPVNWEFPKTLKGATSTTTFTVKNTSPASATILSIGDDLLWNYNNLSSGYRVSANNCNGITLAANATCSVTVEFAPANAGEARGRIDVISAQGNAFTTVTGFGVVSLTPLAPSPTAINFGRWNPSPGLVVPVARIRLTNPTNFNVAVLSNGFKNINTNFVLNNADCGRVGYHSYAAQGSCDLSISYNLNGSASDVSNVLVLKTELGVLELPLSIEFGATPSALSISSIDIDPLLVDTPTLSQAITVRNAGTTAANVYGLLVGQKMFRPFKSISQGSGGTCPGAGAGFTLPAGQACTIVVEVLADAKSDLIGNRIYLASDVGSSFGEITANSTIPGAQPLIVSPSSIDFGAFSRDGYYVGVQRILLTNPNSFSVYLADQAISDSLYSLNSDIGERLQPCNFAYEQNQTGWSVPAGGSCSLNVNSPSFAPLTNGSTPLYLDSSAGATLINVSRSAVDTQLLSVDAQLNFNSVTKGSQAATTVVLKNLGADAISVIGSATSSSNGLSIISGGTCGNAFPLSIAAGAACTLKMGYLVPIDERNTYYSGGVQFFSTGGIVSLGYSGYVITNPVALTSDKSALDFGRIERGASGTAQKIVITNPAATGLQIFALRVSDGFYFSSAYATNPCPSHSTLAPGSCSFEVLASSSFDAGERLGTLTLDTSGGSISVSLRVFTVAPPSLSILNSSLVSNGQSESAAGALTLLNSTGEPIALNSITYSSSSFKLAGGTCGYSGAYTLPAGASCTLAVAYRPVPGACLNCREVASINVSTSNGAVSTNLFGITTPNLTLDTTTKTGVPQDIWIESEPILLTGLVGGGGQGTISGGEVSVGCTGNYSSASFAARTDTTLCVRVKSATTDSTRSTADFYVTSGGATPINNRGSFTVITGQSLLPHYYQSILERAPDAAGRSYWGTELWRMMQSRADQVEGYRVIAFGFFNSAEYLARNRTDRDYISDLYKTFFNRTPASSEVDGWMTYLPVQGRDGIMHHFLHSAEFDILMRNQLGINGSARPETFAVVDFYRGFFRRLPDVVGLTGWVNEYRKAQCAPESTKAASVAATARAISNGFLNSAEYQARGTSNSQFVNDLYSGFLRRGADIGGFNGWKAQLDSGRLTRAQIMEGFIGSPEFSSRVGQVATALCGQ